MLAMLLLAVPAAAAAAAVTPRPIDIANSTQLFVDDFLVATKTANLVRSLHRPDCSRVAVTTDAPWERNYTMGLIGTNVILREDGTLQLTYSLRNSTIGCTRGKYDKNNDMPPCSAHWAPQPNYEPSAGNIYIGYAESTDGGLTFQKPLQHKYSVRGSTANNFIAIASFASNGLSIFVDPNEPPGSPKRYRGTSADLALTSHDGKNWTTIGRMMPPSTIPAASDEGMPGHGAFDTDGIIFWNPACEGGGGCYSFFTRWDRSPQPLPALGDEPRLGANLGRAVRRIDSKHLDSVLNNTCSTGCSAVTPKGPRCDSHWNCPIGSWENASVVMGGDEVDLATHAGTGVPMDYYGSTPWYQPLGSGYGIYWMAAVRFWHWGSAVTGTYDVALASSRDGRNFTFVERTAWLSPGLDGSRGSRRLWFAPPGPIRVGDEELYFVSRANTDEYSGPSIDPKSPHGEWEAEVTCLAPQKTHFA